MSNDFEDILYSRLRPHLGVDPSDPAEAIGRQQTQAIADRSLNKIFGEEVYTISAPKSKFKVGDLVKPRPPWTGAWRGIVTDRDPATGCPIVRWSSEETAHLVPDNRLELLTA